ncbi:hypothetical protein [Salinicoccus sp. HZC-1]|uniref:hypothetical protein n=1 Tax=Salinicoccus sp. HZC-1 TaxID=3385497 RepID=UPI00398AF1D1
MKILVAGGIYINTEQTEHIELAGGFKTAGLVGSHSRHAVYIHTNFSTEETKITSAIKKSLREQGVDPRYAGTVSDVYGRLDKEGFESGSNLYETVRLDHRFRKKLEAFDVFILTTDIAERDFRWLLTFANNHRIKTHVFTCGEYPVRHDNGRIHVHTLYDPEGATDSDGEQSQPAYHEHIGTIKDILQADGIIEPLPVERAFSEQPKSPLYDAGRFIAQIAALALVAALVLGGAIFLLQQISGPGEEYETYIDWQAPVDHDSCSTIEECKNLGDRYLGELAEYVDIQDEPHVFIENRSRFDYITYQVGGDFQLTDPDYQADLPIGTEAEFMGIWEKFTAIIPNERIASISQFNLFSDGEGNTLAYVDIQPEGTTLGVDIRDNDNRASQYRTLIHEYGHIHSLPSEDFTDECIGTELDCLKEDTLMADYISRFWSQYGDKWIENKYKSDPEKEAFFNNNINDFYVPYQALNPKEDYAVTFVSFITKSMPQGDSQLKEVKVRAFYEDPDLVALRVDILENLLAYEKERASNEA